MWWWAVVDRAQQLRDWSEPLGMTGSALSLAVLLGLSAWHTTRKIVWEEHHFAWEYRDSARWVAFAMLALMPYAAHSLVRWMDNWYDTPTGYYSSHCKPGQSKLDCRIINLPAQESQPILISNTRITPTIRSTSGRDSIFFGVESSEPGYEIRDSGVSVYANEDCFTHFEFMGIRFLLIVLLDDRNQTQVGVISGPGKLRREEAELGAPRCGKDGLPSFRRRRF